MEWRGRRQSSNIEDRRAEGPLGGGLGGGFRPGGGFRIPMGSGRGGGLSIGTIIFLVVIYFVFKAMGIDLLQVVSGEAPRPAGYEQSEQQSSPGEEDTKAFVSTVLAETEETWNGIFKANGQTYREPTLVLFRNATRSECGNASSASGPFYCPVDQKVYLDMAFFDELSQRFNASGDFAQAYVIAHEVGHHVQNLLGILPKVNEARQRMSEEQSNQMSVRTELQADCFAGIWGKYTAQKGLLEQGDLEEALNAATQIGDDRLQRRSQGYVVPESFNHGTSQQRSTWFKRGYDSGKLSACDTFNNPV